MKVSLIIDDGMGKIESDQTLSISLPNRNRISKKRESVSERAMFRHNRFPPPTAESIADIIERIVSQGGDDNCSVATLVTRHALWLKLMMSLKSQIHEAGKRKSTCTSLNDNFNTKKMRKRRRNHHARKLHILKDSVYNPYDSKYSLSLASNAHITRSKEAYRKKEQVEPISMEYMWDSNCNLGIKESYTPTETLYNDPIENMNVQDIQNHVEKIRLERKQRKFERFAALLQKLLDHPKNPKGLFNIPVDPIALNIPTYRQIIQQPMDLGQIRDKMENGQYLDCQTFADDVRLVFDNAMLFNPPNHYVHTCASLMSDFFEENLRTILSRMQTEANDLSHFCTTCDGHTCAICLDKCFEFSISPLSCSGPCGTSIRRGATFYQSRDGTRIWCSRCYIKPARGKKKVDCFSSRPKEPTLDDVRGELIKKKCEVELEPWVYCTGCKSWMHQICTMYRNVSEEPFRCILCRKTMKAKKSLSLNSIRSIPCSDNIPHTKMSLFIEHFVRQELVQLGNHEVAKSLNIRVVSSIAKTQTVPASVQQVFSVNVPEAIYPSTIPYVSKAIYMFQKQDGLDVCLFAMYVQEYNADCPSISNQKTVYVAYLDSVQYLQPPCLRTLVYHHILVGYLDFARQQGFNKAHIWSCPPQRSVSYVFWCHPKHQRTPGVEHLRTWYKKMLHLACKKGVISGWSTFYERYFSYGDETVKDPSAPCVSTRRHSIRDMTQKPYRWPCSLIPPCFDGDFWPAEAERVIHKLMKDNLTKKTREAYNRGIAGSPVSYTSEESIEEAISLRDLFKSVLASIKLVQEDLLVVDLKVEGYTWKDSLHEDQLSFKFVDTRQAFHQLCASDCFQFDSLRRAKHSTMMLLYHLFTPQLSMHHYFCDSCGFLIEAEHFWHCLTCEDFALCDWCKKTAQHKHIMEFGERNI